MLRVLLPLIAVGLAVYALVDLASSDEEDRGGIPKGLWVVLIVLLPFLGPIAWVLVKRSQRSTPRYRTGGRPTTGGAGGSRRRRTGPVAPDDDPEFLWRLEQQQRRQGRANPAGPDRPVTDDAPAQDAGEPDADGTDGDAGPSGSGTERDEPGGR